MSKLIIHARDKKHQPVCAKVKIINTENNINSSDEDSILVEYINGTKEFDIPYDEVIVYITCGKLIRPYREKISLSKTETNTVTAIMERVVEPAKYGLYSFDAHNHVSRKNYDREKTINLEQAAVIAKAEDLNCLFAGVPYDYDNHKEAKTGKLRSELPYRRQYSTLLSEIKNNSFILDIGNEYCKYRYGHVFMFNYDQQPPVDRYRDPLYYPYEKASHISGTKEPEFGNVPISNAVYCSKGEHSVAAYAHPTSWWYDDENKSFVTNIASTLGFDILTGAVDSLVIMGYKPDCKFYQDIWYELLNNGYFVPGIAETDAIMDSEYFEMPPYKTFVYLTELSLNNIGDAVKAGRCMVTSGPILHFTVDGQLPGSCLNRENEKKYVLSIEAKACCDSPLSKIEIILNGEKHAEISATGESYTKKRFEISNLTQDSYVLVKCYDLAGNLAISNPIFIRNSPFVNIDYHAKVDIDVYKGKLPATGTFWAGEKGTEVHFDGRVSCRIRPHESIFIKVRDEIKGIKLFYHQKIQDIFRKLYSGEFNKDRLYKPGEVPAKAFAVSEIREILDCVDMELFFDENEEDNVGATSDYHDTHTRSDLVLENKYRELKYEEIKIPDYKEVSDSLPMPLWEGHDIVIDCYKRAWEIAWSKLRQPEKGSGLPSNFLYTEFSNSIFMWGLSFITQYGKYARKSFDFIGSLNNFYAKQHKDGFICRQINIFTGNDTFERFDPASTGPNIMAWAEWEDYQLSGDKNRLKMVFPALAAYHRWLRKYRTWKDGTYFSSGWGCGMDNQPRIEDGYSPEFDHGHMSWIDITAQQVLSAKTLIKISKEIDRDAETLDMVQEIELLIEYVNKYMWDEEEKFYFDRYKDGSLSKEKTIGAYWLLLTDMVPESRLDAFIGHLQDSNSFHTIHPVPSLARNSGGFYEDGGDYWRGGVWCITNLMVVKGLVSKGYGKLAHEISHKHVTMVAEVFMKTGSIWESYDALKAQPGKLAGKFVRNEFVGFSGVGPITMLIEEVIGLKPDVARNSLIWDINLTEGHGIQRYSFGVDGKIDLYCHPRKDRMSEPVIDAVSNKSISLIIRWENSEKTIIIPKGGENK